MKRYLKYFSDSHFNLTCWHPAQNILFAHENEKSFLYAYIDIAYKTYCHSNEINMLNNSEKFDVIYQIIDNYVDDLKSKFSEIKQLLNLYGMYFRYKSLPVVRIGNWTPNMENEFTYDQSIQDKYYQSKSKFNVLQDPSYHVQKVCDLFKSLILLLSISENSGDSDKFYILKKKFIQEINIICETDPYICRMPYNKITYKNPYGCSVNESGYPQTVEGCALNSGICTNSHKCGTCVASPC